MSGAADGGVRLRSAVQSDLEELVELEAMAFDDPWPALSVAPMLDDPKALVLVAADGVLAGYVAFSLSVGEAELLRLAVRPSHRRRGIGRRLGQEGLAQVERAGFQRVFLEVREANRDARSLYSSLGFEQIGRRSAYYQDGSDALVLRRRLSEGSTLPLS